MVSIRVPEDLKEEMSRLGLGWADYIRQAIEERVKAEKMRRACKVMGEVREKIRGVRFDSVEVIRKARNSR